MRDIEERKVMRDIHNIAVSLNAISKELQKLNRRAIVIGDAGAGDIDEKSDFDTSYEEPLGILR